MWTIPYNTRWRGQHSRHPRRMRNPQFYVAGKRPMAALLWWESYTWKSIPYLEMWLLPIVLPIVLGTKYRANVTLEWQTVAGSVMVDSGLLLSYLRSQLNTSQITWNSQSVSSGNVRQIRHRVAYKCTTRISHPVHRLSYITWIYGHGLKSMIDMVWIT